MNTHKKIPIHLPEDFDPQPPFVEMKFTESGDMVLSVAILTGKKTINPARAARAHRRLENQSRDLWLELLGEKPKAKKRAAKVDRPGAESRAPIQRFHLILERLRFGSATLSELGKMLEISARTVARDVEFLRSRLLMPIETNWQGCFLTQTVTRCPLCPP
jgi:hypothetical protein